MKPRYSNIHSSSLLRRSGVFTKTFGLSLGLAVVGMSPLAQATSYTWNLNAATGTWDSNASWNPNTGFPNVAGDVANFTNNITVDNAPAPSTGVTVGIINIVDPGRSNSFTIGANGGSTITLNNSGVGAQVNFNDGANDTLAAPLVLGAAGLTITNNGSVSRTHTVSGGVTGTGNLTLTDSRTAGGSSQFNISTGSINHIGTLTVNANATAGTAMTINSIIGSNVTSLTKNGTATVNLNGANTYTGGTVVNLGTLSVGAAGTLGDPAGPLAVNNTNLGAGTNVGLGLSTGLDTTTGSLSGTIATPSSGTNTATITTRSGRAFTVNQTTNGIFAGTITGPGSGFTLGSSSTNMLTLSGTSNYTGTTTINAGTLNVTGALNGTGAVAVNGSATLKGSGTIAGTVTVAGDSAAPGQGTIDLTNGSAGTLSLGGGLTIGGASSGLLSNLKFDVGATADLIALPGTLTVEAGGANISITNIGGLSAGQTYNLMTFVNGAGTGFATGTGTAVGSLTLTNPTVSFGVTGVLNVTGSSVELVTSGAATPTTAYWKGSKGATWVANSGGTGNFTTNAAGTTFVQAYPGATTDVIFSATGASNFTHTLGQPFAANSVTFSSASAVTINADGNTLTVGGGGLVVQSGAGAVSIGAHLAGDGAVTNAGTLTLAGNSSFTGGIVNSGTLALAGANSFTGGIVNTGSLTAASTGAFAGNDLAVNAGTVDLNGNSNSVGLLSGNSGTAITNNTTGSATLTTNSASEGTFSGTLQDGGAGKILSLTKMGIGTLTLSGGNAYSGMTTVLAGSLAIDSNSALGTSGLTLGGSGSITPTIFASGGARTISSNILLDVQTTGNATFGGSNDLTINGTVTGNGSRTLTIENTGATRLDGSVFLSNENTTAGRILTINGTNGLTISGAVANNNVGNSVAAGLTYSGSGTLILSGNNTYTGNTNITSGTLQLQAHAGNTTGVTAHLLGAGTFSMASGTTLQLRGDTTDTTFAGYSSATLGSAATIDVNRLTVAGSGATLKTGSFTSSNVTLNVTGGNGYSLTTGTIQDNFSAAGTAHVNTLNPTTANLTTSGLTSINGTGGTSTVNWVLDGTAANNFVTGVINNGQSNTRATSVTKSNTSTWTLSGVNTYQGTTTVNGGILSITQNNSLPNGAAVHIATAGTLDLSHLGTDSVGSFFIDGVQQIAGEWGGPLSGAANTTPRMSGTGKINVINGPSAYGNWATSKGLTGANNGSTQDPENDGIANLLEFVLNGNPLASDTSILPVQSDDGTYFIFTFNRRDDSLTEVTLTFEYGSDLVGWTPVAIPALATGIPVNITDTGIVTDQVQVKVLKSNEVGGKLFGHLKAVK